jgi:hypothetical protein
MFLDHLSFILHGALVGASSLWLRWQGNTKHEQPQKVQAFNQSSILILFCFGGVATIAFHIAPTNAIFI